MRGRRKAVLEKGAWLKGVCVSSRAVKFVQLGLWAVWCSCDSIKAVV